MSLHDEKMDFTTIYQSDFDRKQGSVFTCLPPADSNPVTSPWCQYLVPDASLVHLLPAGGCYEDPACVLHRNHIKCMPDLELVKKQFQVRGQSLYQFDFCRTGDFVSKRICNEKIITLPSNWKTPLSSQRCSYRDPKSIMKLSVDHQRFSYKDNLIPNEKERGVLQVKTGESDYMSNCGSLGAFIIQEKLHGAGRPKAMSLWEVKRRLALLDQGIILDD